MPSATWIDMPPCRVLTSTVRHAWVVPYIVVIVFEAGSESRPLPLSYLSWLTAPSSCVSIDSIQSPTISRKPPDTEIEAV